MKHLTFFKHNINQEKVCNFDELERGDYVYYAELRKSSGYNFIQCYRSQFDRIEYGNCVYTADPKVDNPTCLEVDDITQSSHIETTTDYVHIMTTTMQEFCNCLKKFNLTVPADIKTYNLK